MQTLKEIKEFLDSVNYGQKRDYKKIEIFVDGQYEATTTWAKNCKVAELAYRLKVGTSDNCKIKGFRK